MSIIQWRADGYAVLPILQPVQYRSLVLREFLPIRCWVTVCRQIKPSASCDDFWRTRAIVLSRMI